jgi:hypothetical protein
MTTLVHEATSPSRVAYGAAPRCDGWPECGCTAEATETILGFQLCTPCARAFVAPDPDYTPVGAPVTPTRTRRVVVKQSAKIARGLPPACVWCSSTAHPPTKCPVAAAMTGQPLIEGLRAEIAELKAELEQARNETERWQNECFTVRGAAFKILEALNYASKKVPPKNLFAFLFGDHPERQHAAIAALRSVLS